MTKDQPEVPDPYTEEQILAILEWFEEQIKRADMTHEEKCTKKVAT